MQNYHYYINNTLDELSLLNDTLNTVLSGQDISAEAIYAVCLTLDEMGTNIIKYSYDDTGIHQISIDLTVDDKEIELRMEDDGHEFDPLKASEPDTTLPPEERPIGGLGIHLVRNSVQSMHYQRMNGINRLAVKVIL